MKTQLVFTTTNHLQQSRQFVTMELEMVALEHDFQILIIVTSVRL